jgi:hypothetical protein
MVTHENRLHFCYYLGIPSQDVLYIEELQNVNKIDNNKAVQYRVRSEKKSFLVVDH